MNRESVDGTPFSEADVDRWAREAEVGFPGATFGKVRAGRPPALGDDVKRITVRLSAVQRARLLARAKREHTSVSEVLRHLVDGA